MKAILLLIALLISGCGTTGNNTRVIPPEVWPYVNEFETQAKNYGHTHNKNIVITLSEAMPDNYLGWCIGHNDEVPLVQLNKKRWGQLSNIGKKWLVFHELGHCWLHFSHAQDYRRDIMYYQIYPVSNWSSQNAEANWEQIMYLFFTRDYERLP